MEFKAISIVFVNQLSANMNYIFFHIDYILLQTFFDLSMMEVATKIAVEYGIPVYCMMTFEKRRRTIMGNTVKQIIDTLTPLGIQGIGMNCSLGPEESLEVIEEYHKLTDLP